MPGASLPGRRYPLLARHRFPACRRRSPVKSKLIRTLCSGASLLVSLACLGVLTVAMPAHAQTPPPDLQRLIDALDLTDRRIQLAQDLLAASPNHQAAAEVDMAVSL